MKFLLVGNGGFYNRGCEAIAYTTIALLKKKYSKPTFILTSFFEEDAFKINEMGAKFLPALAEKIWKLGSREWFLRQFYKVFLKNRIWELKYLSINKELETSDAILFVGGDNYSLDYGDPKYHLDLIKLIKKNKKKMVLWAASIGPFKKECENLREVVECLRSLDLITAREPNTVEYLKEIGIESNVRLTADSAFLLSEEEFETKDFLPKSPFLGFNMSPILPKYSYGKLDNDGIIASAATFLRKVIEKYNLEILLVPHTMRPKELDSDYSILKQIQKKAGLSARISIVPPYLNAMQLKYVISKCRFFIGARTHSIIASLSSCIPTISIGYSLKSKGINKDIFGSYDYLIDTKDYSTDVLLERFEIMYNNEEEIVHLLKLRIPEIQKRACMGADLLDQILG